MALQGNLDTFRLEEILQLIAGQQKSGVLRLTSGDQRVALVFENGRIVSTHEPGARDLSSLEVSLKDMRRLPEAQLARLAELRSADGSDPQDVVLSAHMIKPDELAAFIEEHVQDLLLRVLTWRSAGYEFINRALNQPSSGFRITFRTEGVLMEAMRRLDELSRWKRVLSSPSISLSLRGPSQGRDSDARRRRILEALATPHTLGELEETLPLWRFELYEALHELWDAGQLEVQGARAVKTGEQIRRRLARSPIEQIGFGASLVIGMAVFALLSSLLFSRVFTPGSTAGLSVWEKALIAQYYDDARLEAEKRRALHGAYPASLANVPGWRGVPAGAVNPAEPSNLQRILENPTL